MQRFRPKIPGFDQKLLRFDRKEISCVLTCLVDVSHRIKLADREKVPLGRNDTLVPEDHNIPELQFCCTAHVARRTVYVVLMEGEGFYNGDEMVPQEIYELRDGDVLGFSEDDKHSYLVSFVIADFKWPGCLNTPFS